MTADPLDHVPPPEAVRALLAESVRRSDLLRSLLRVARRKAAYDRPATADLIAEATRRGLPLTTADRLATPDPNGRPILTLRDELAGAEGGAE